jgi:hypothetical protein
MSAMSEGHRRRRLTTFTALGFLVGSILFAIGVPLSLNTSLVPTVGAAAFFVGSIFFTGAALLQLVLSVEDLPPSVTQRREPAWFARLVRPRTVDWTASTIQFVGTLWFNITTFLGLVDATGSGDVSATAVWRPDAWGSVAFLVSSAIAFAPEVRRRRHSHARDRSWAIAALNLLGSVFFGVSAVGAWTDPSTGALLNESWANNGTVLGALCFLGGAALLLPRATSQPVTAS